MNVENEEYPWVMNIKASDVRSLFPDGRSIISWSMIFALERYMYGRLKFIGMPRVFVNCRWSRNNDTGRRTEALHTLSDHYCHVVSAADVLAFVSCRIRSAPHSCSIATLADACVIRVEITRPFSRAGYLAIARWYPVSPVSRFDTEVFFNSDSNFNVIEWLNTFPIRWIDERTSFIFYVTAILLNLDFKWTRKTNYLFIY